MRTNTRHKNLPIEDLSRRKMLRCLSCDKPFMTVPEIRRCPRCKKNSSVGGEGKGETIWNFER